MGFIGSKKVFIIAEAGVNHNGSLEIGRKLIEFAAAAGADAVKFQTFKAEKTAARSAQMAEYQKTDSSGSETQFEMLKRLELDAMAHHELMRHCKSLNIQFLSSPFDLESIELLHSLDLKILKIPSGEITNFPYLRKIGGLGKQLILSTGMSDLAEIKNALRVLYSAGTTSEQITVMHCNTEYPTPMEDVNLRCMQTMADEFQVPVGYSDHTLGIEIPVAAVALGASVIEKHFTLDRNLIGPDHKASLVPQDFETMVRAIRNIEIALGNSNKRPTPSEIKNRSIARKSIVAARKIQKGEVFSDENLTTKRPGNGVSPMRWGEIIGTVASQDYKVDDLI